MDVKLPPLPEPEVWCSARDARVNFTRHQMEAYARAALRDAPQAEGWVMAGWLREWEGDDSDIGAWCFVADESEKDESPNWQPVYWRVAPSAPTAVELDERDTCEWSDDDYGNWESSCGELWSFIEGGPKENRVSFCHNCGKPAIVRASKGTP